MPTFVTETGTGGKVMLASNSIGNVTKWTFRRQIDSKRVATSETGGFKLSIPGAKFGDGTIEMLLDVGAASPINEGDQPTLKLYVDAGTTHFWSVPCTVKEANVTANIDAGEPPEVEFSFENNGAWTAPTFP